MPQNLLPSVSPFLSHLDHAWMVTSYLPCRGSISQYFQSIGSRIPLELFIWAIIPLYSNVYVTFIANRLFTCRYGLVRHDKKLDWTGGWKRWAISPSGSRTHRNVHIHLIGLWTELRAQEHSSCLRRNISSHQFCKKLGVSPRSSIVH